MYICADRSARSAQASSESGVHIERWQSSDGECSRYQRGGVQDRQLQDRFYVYRLARGDQYRRHDTTVPSGRNEILNWPLRKVRHGNQFGAPGTEVQAHELTASVAG